MLEVGADTFRDIVPQEVRDAGGAPTGVLKDNARALVDRAVPDPSPARQDRALDRSSPRRGETLRFRVQNAGKEMHEFVIGTKAENAKHAELMIKFPNMEHDEPYMAHVSPGKTGEIVWTFNRAGTFEFACLIAGHYSAGMVGTINVTA